MFNTSEKVARINQRMDCMKQFSNLEGDLIRVFWITPDYLVKFIESFTFVNNIVIFTLSNLGKLHGMLIFCKTILFILNHA